MSRLPALVRLAWGAALLAAPDRLVALTGATSTAGSRRLVRVLGARQAAQAGVQLAGRAPRAGAAVDALHGLSMVGLAAVSRRWRRPAAADAVVAAGFAFTGATCRPRRRRVSQLPLSIRG